MVSGKILKQTGRKQQDGDEQRGGGGWQAFLRHSVEQGAIVAPQEGFLDRVAEQFRRSDRILAGGP